MEDYCEMLKAETGPDPEPFHPNTKAVPSWPPMNIVAYSLSSGRWARYQIYTLWLFTFSDIKTIVAPQTTFAIFTALSQAAKVPSIISGEDLRDRDTTISRDAILARTPLIIFWIWIHLLPFNISHQRQPGSLQEDAINKPWRPLVTERWSNKTARNSMLSFYALAILASFIICDGGSRSSLALMLLGYWYNDCGGADNHAIVRNFINALGISAFSVGALEVARKQELQFEPFSLGSGPMLENWLIILTLILFSTIQLQDMGDMEGDLARGRRTFPLRYGESFTRCFNLVVLLFWTICCPRFWDSGLSGYVCVVPLGLYVAYRAVALRSTEEDNDTYRIYNAWLASLYLLPLIKSS